MKRRFLDYARKRRTDSEVRDDGRSRDALQDFLGDFFLQIVFSILGLAVVLFYIWWRF